MSWRLRPLLAASAFVACLVVAELVRSIPPGHSASALRIVLAAAFTGLAVFCAYIAIKGLELRREIRTEKARLRQNIEGFSTWFKVQTDRYKEVRNDMNDDQTAGGIVQSTVIANAQASELVGYLRTVREKWLGDVANPKDTLLKHAGVKELSQVDRALANAYDQASGHLDEARQRLHSEVAELVQDIGGADLDRVFQRTLDQMGIQELLAPW